MTIAADIIQGLMHDAHALIILAMLAGGMAAVTYLQRKTEI